ncbi:hypothetical protein A5742_27525 [Mycolicibacterium fortuitum]|uniref:Uncharacterized protein n=2 Tax=Mycolicibacterium fortuitum TaxID=1766 RepID=A0ABD6QM89_MYCFO|nr:hypothetical protein A5742_27525 [Mycolicibacterium fortuitum]
MGLVPYLFYAAPAAVPTAFLWWGQRKAKAHRKTDKPLLTEIHEQTVNDHKEKSNLREDVDELKAGSLKLDEKIDHVLKVVTDGFSGIHQEIRTERLERIAGDERGR